MRNPMGPVECPFNQWLTFYRRSFTNHPTDAESCTTISALNADSGTASYTRSASSDLTQLGHEKAFGGMACASYARLRRLVMPLLVFGQIDGDERTCARTYARPFARPFRRHTTTGSDLAVSKYDAKSAVLRGEWHTAARGERSRACLGAKWSEVQILSPRPSGKWHRTHERTGAARCAAPVLSCVRCHFGAIYAKSRSSGIVNSRPVRRIGARRASARLRPDIQQIHLQCGRNPHAATAGRAAPGCSARPLRRKDLLRHPVNHLCCSNRRS